MTHERNERETECRTPLAKAIHFHLFSFSNRCSACQLGTDTLIYWSGCVSGMQIHIHLNMCFSLSNHGGVPPTPLTLKPAHLLIQSIFIQCTFTYSYSQHASSGSCFSLCLFPLSFFFTLIKCTTILKLLHRVMGV